MTSKAPSTRTPAQLAALRRHAMTWAWERARHLVTCYRPGIIHIPTKARQLLKQGWVEAKLAERHGHLVVAEAAAPTPAPAARAAAFIRREIEDLENRDRLGVFGLARLSTLTAELRAAEHHAS